MSLGFNPIASFVPFIGPAIQQGLNGTSMNYWQNMTAPAWNTWKSKFIKEADGKLFVIDPSQGDQIVSESMSYGMLLAVQMNDQKTFEGLLLGLRELEGKGLPVWRGYLDRAGNFVIRKDSDAISASDAEQDIAMSLIQAQVFVEKGIWKAPTNPQTGDEDDKYFGMRAQEYLNMIWDKEVTRAGEAYIMKPSEDWGYHPGGAIVNPSYIMPAWYDYFASFDNNPNHKWKELKKYSYEMLSAAFKHYGRIPDWCVAVYSDRQFTIYDFDGKSTRMSYDAIRVLWRVAQDAMWTADPVEKARAVKLCRAIILSIKDKNPDDLNLGNEGFIAMYALGAKGAGILLPGETANDVQYFAEWQSELEKSLKYHYQTSSQASNKYYEESLSLFGALLLGGKFTDIASRAILPKDSPQIAEIRARHLSWPYYYLEYVPILGPAISPSENMSRLWLDGTRRADTDMLIYNIEWLEGRDPASMRTMYIRMQFCGNLMAWGYYDEAIAQYKITLENFKYIDWDISPDENAERQKIIKKAVLGLLAALYKSGRTLDGIEIFAGITEKDRSNIIAHFALANIYSVLPFSGYDKLAIKKCQTSLRLAALLKIDDPEMVMNSILTIASVIAAKGRKDASSENFEGAATAYDAVKVLCDSAVSGKLDEESLNVLQKKLDLNLDASMISELNKLLGKLKPEEKNKIKAEEADMLFSLTSAMLTSAEIRIDIEAAKDEPEELDLDLLSAGQGRSVKSVISPLYDNITALYKDVLLNAEGGSIISDMDESEEKGRFEEMIYKSCLGLMRTHSNLGRLKTILGQDGSSDFEMALAINDTMLEALTDYKCKRNLRKVLGQELYDSISSKMEKVRAFKKGQSQRGKFLRAAAAEVRIERIQILNDRRDYGEAIKEYESLIALNIPIGRVRPHFERIIYYIDNREYDAAIGDCEYLADEALLSALRKSSLMIEEEVLSASSKAKIAQVKALLLEMLENEDYIGTGIISNEMGKMMEKYKNAIAFLTELERDPAISPRNRDIISRALALARGTEENGNVTAKFGDAYSMLVRCLEINRMLEIELLRVREGSADMGRIRDEAEMIGQLKEVKALLKDGKYAEARKLCKKLVTLCEGALDEEAPNSDIQKAVLLDATPKYALALAKSGRPFEAVAIYKSLLGIDYNFVEFESIEATRPVILSEDVRTSIMILEDKEFKGFADTMFRGAPYIKNLVLGKLANLFIWKEAQDAYVKIGGKALSKESMRLCVNYYEKVRQADPSDAQLTLTLLRLSFWVKDLSRMDYYLKESKKIWDSFSDPEKGEIKMTEGIFEQMRGNRGRAAELMREANILLGKEGGR